MAAPPGHRPLPLLPQSHYDLLPEGDSAGEESESDEGASEPSGRGAANSARPDFLPAGSELRVDSSDGRLYPLHSFLQEYGSAEGRRRWATAATLRCGGPHAELAGVADSGSPRGGGASGHMLRDYQLRTTACSLCQSLGPSCQTGIAECALCRRCSRCAAQHPVCPRRGAPPAPAMVCWTDASGRAVQVSAAAAPGLLACGAAGSAPLRLTSRLEWVPASSSGVARVRLLEPNIAFTLPRSLTAAGRVAEQLRALADARGAAHTLPGYVDCDGWTLPRTIPAPQNATGGAVCCVLGATSSRAAAAYPDGSVHVWDLRRGAGRHLWGLVVRGGQGANGTPAPPALSGQLVDLSPCERYVAAAGGPGGGVLLAANGETVIRWEAVRVTAVRFSPCGRWLLACDPTGGTVWSLKDRTRRCYLPPEVSAGLRASAPRMAFSPAGGVIATTAGAAGDAACSPALISRWLLGDGTGALLRTLSPKHGGVVTTVQFGASGEELLSASADGELRLWSCATGAVVASLFALPPLQSAGLLGGGRALAAASGGFLRVWRRRHSTGGEGELAACEPLPGAFQSMDISGGRIAVGCSDGAVRLVPLPPSVRGCDSCPLWRTRHALAHGGQRGLQLLLLQQRRLAALPPLPAGLGLLRALPPALQAAVAAYLPAPCDGVVDSGGEPGSDAAGYCTLQ
eukprot:TRINITY_DN10577_c0_g1_i1.p1 TRINITY_DN10577_c0_g1~~TRINITY_DN10577_c0_g1_i1.p1  ORF type:complete len:710 (+),score=119.38 TRINITY_DN10577_c0_g1_i1:78-2132(+)